MSACGSGETAKSSLPAWPLAPTAAHSISRRASHLSPFPALSPDLRHPHSVLHWALTNSLFRSDLAFVGNATLFFSLLSFSYCRVSSVPASLVLKRYRIPYSTCQPPTTNHQPATPPIEPTRSFVRILDIHLTSDLGAIVPVVFLLTTGFWCDAVLLADPSLDLDVLQPL